MNRECPLKYMHAQVSTGALETLQSGRPQSLPPHEYLSFKNPDPYLFAIILNTTVSISTLLANPCAMPCIYKLRNLFQLSSASTSEAVFFFFLVLFSVQPKSFYTCHAVVFLLVQRNVFPLLLALWTKVLFVVFLNIRTQIRLRPNSQWIQGQMNGTGTLYCKRNLKIQKCGIYYFLSITVDVRSFVFFLFFFKAVCCRFQVQRSLAQSLDMYYVILLPCQWALRRCASWEWVSTHRNS